MPKRSAASPTSRLTFAAKSVAGLVRQDNQDSFATLYTPQGALLLVADGMGGHKSGELASQKAVSVLSHALRGGSRHPPLAIARAVQRANLEIFDYGVSHPESQGMGTTLTLVYIGSTCATIGHVGDSRAYLIRQGTIEQLTHDHSWVADRVRQGLLNTSEARHHQWRNIITNALGNQPTVQLDLSALELQTGDKLLLCSDGLTSLLADSLILQLVEAHPLPEAVEALVARADERGSPDNVTVILAEVGEMSTEPVAYNQPADAVSVVITADDETFANVEEAFPYRGRLASLRRHPLYPYRYWLLGCVSLLALFLVFALR